ncbi:cellulose binding domain-containing protein [Streptomyces pharetrae]|uniref:cellulose binding domain-containing protein n=1 Tax=Streptomyces pharetrae TaxID=291370 RepID=UPI000A3421C5
MVMFEVRPYAPASGRVTARSVAHNTTIAPGASLDIGFQAAHTGNTTPPGSCTLNGTACAVAVGRAVVTGRPTR